MCLFLISALATHHLDRVLALDGCRAGRLLLVRSAALQRPNEPPPEIAPELAATDLPKRSITPGTVVGMLLVVGIIIFAGMMMFGGGGPSPPCTSSSGVCWCWRAWPAFGTPPPDCGWTCAVVRCLPTAAIMSEEAVLMRKGILMSTLGVLIPSVLLVAAVTFATPERQATEKANESAPAVATQPVPALR